MTITVPLDGAAAALRQQISGEVLTATDPGYEDLRLPSLWYPPRPPTWRRLCATPSTMAWLWPSRQPATAWPPLLKDRC